MFLNMFSTMSTCSTVQVDLLSKAGPGVLDRYVTGLRLEQNHKAFNAHRGVPSQSVD